MLLVGLEHYLSLSHHLLGLKDYFLKKAFPFLRFPTSTPADKSLRATSSQSCAYVFCGYSVCLPLSNCTQPFDFKEVWRKWETLTVFADHGASIHLQCLPYY
jgi:hypothetical protein